MGINPRTGSIAGLLTDLQLLQELGKVPVKAFEAKARYCTWLMAAQDGGRQPCMLLFCTLRKYTCMHIPKACSAVALSQTRPLHVGEPEHRCQNAFFASVCAQYQMSYCLLCKLGKSPVTSCSMTMAGSRLADCSPQTRSRPASHKNMSSHAFNMLTTHN